MNIDVNEGLKTVSKLGPGHFIAVLALAMVCGAGWVVHSGLTDVHVDLVELRHSVERQGDDAEAARSSFAASQARQERLLVAVCYAAANGSEDERRRCEDAAR